jgi:ABC-2 type transport system ATP-binding protein
MERAHEVLQYVGLGESRYRNVETYSAGMKQRAKLAQAIVHDPALVLLDEPTNGMDPAGRVEMLELVDDLARRKGISAILCSHLLRDVESVANEIIVLGNGRVLYKKMAERLGGAKETVYSVRVRGDRAALVRALREGGLAVTEDESAARTLVTLPHGAEPAVIHKAAAAAGCVVQRLEPRVEKLEDLFTEAIGELGNAHL